MSDDGPTLLFDGVCTLCDRSVQFVLDHESVASFRFASLQSEVGRQLLARCGLDGASTDSVVLVENGTCHVRSEAAWRVAARLDAPWRWIALGRWVPRSVRDRVYDVVARNRYRWFGTRDECRLPEPGVRERFLDADELASSDRTS
ncbi:thiol-disulfide oxidoreductase DCC family protein [Rubrivirga sp.]|uniref:thiol-disulfide oxidoreductase DCC family protein n=1 Tax=Rubrivirga sp. TaxID=1885344 RepID=UPI003B51E0B6